MMIKGKPWLIIDTLHLSLKTVYFFIKFMTMIRHTVIKLCMNMNIKSKCTSLTFKRKKNNFWVWIDDKWPTKRSFQIPDQSTSANNLLCLKHETRGTERGTKYNATKICHVSKQTRCDKAWPVYMCLFLLALFSLNKISVCYQLALLLASIFRLNFLIFPSKIKQEMFFHVSTCFFIL